MLMNPSPQPSASRRHVWRWVLIGAGICLTPFVLLAFAAVSYLTLDRDAAALRKHVMAATAADWNTKVQVSVGRITLGAIGQALRFAQHKDMADVRLALQAVRHASVGVYERPSGGGNWPREKLFATADGDMQKRGWIRMVGVADGKETVLIYIPTDMKEDGPVDICLAVVSGKELVVVSTAVDPEALSALVAKHAGDDVKKHLRFARFSF